MTEWLLLAGIFAVVGAIYLSVWFFTRKPYKVYGDYNEIKCKDIGKDTIIGNFNYIASKKIGKKNKIHNHVNLYPDSEIGDYNVINSFVNINQYTKIGSNNIFGGGVLTADELKMTPRTENIERKQCQIGSNNAIGQHSSLISIKIGNNNIIGANSLCLKDIGNNEKWYGVPAKLMGTVTSDELKLFRK